MSGHSFGEIAAGLADFFERKSRPWRDSYDVDDPRAKPWVRVLDGSREAWIVAKNALGRTCRETIVRHRREARGALRNDQEVDKQRLRQGDDLVLEAFLDDFNPADGKLFTAQATIADELGVSASTVNAALQRLARHGFIKWVRRTEKVDEGAEASHVWGRRRQISNAYGFDWKRSMDGRTWSRLWQLILAGLKRIGRSIIATTTAVLTRILAVADGCDAQVRASKRPGKRDRGRWLAIRHSASTGGEN